MNEAAYEAVNKTWERTVKARALCPYTDASAVGKSGYLSPSWYRDHGAVYFVNLIQPLSAADVKELNQIASFINRSFVISMAAILEEYGVVPYKTNPDCTKQGGDHVQLTKWLRNRFAHGEWEYDNSDAKHVETRQLLEKLFPDECSKSPGFVISIDTVLEPLKKEVLAYIRAAN